MPERTQTLQPLTADFDTGLIESLYTASDGPSLSFLSGLLSHITCRAWVLLNDEQPVAAIWYQCVAERAELLDLRVRASCRRQGFGKQLLWASLVALEGVTQVDLEVRDSNTAARALYHSLSFEETGCRPAYYAQDQGREGAVLMTLALNNRV